MTQDMVSMPKTKRILITGGAGFIGSALVWHLQRKYPQYELTVLDMLTYSGSLDNLPAPDQHSHLNFIHGNIRNEELMDHLVSRADQVIHLAAETHVTRSINEGMPFFMTDVIGTQVVTNAVKRHKETVDRYFFVSTSEVYGTAEGSEPMNEDHPLNSRSPYAAAKAGGDRLVYAYQATHGIPSVILRPFNNFGPRQHVEKAIPRFITNCLKGEPIVIHGDGSAERDWLYVDDHCEAIDALMHVERDYLLGKTLNIGSGEAVNILSIAHKVRDLMGSPDHPIVTAIDRPGNVQRHLADATRLREIIPWAPKVSLDEGLRKTIDWYRGNEALWKKQRDEALVPVEMACGQVEWQ